jgi:serine palmitoyltransferase
MGTFSKSFGAAGGYIVGNKSLIDRLRLRSPDGLYAETMTPPVLMQVIVCIASIMGVATRSISPSPTSTTTEDKYMYPGPAPASILPSWLCLPQSLSSGAEGYERRRRLTFNARYLHTGLKKLGFITYGHPTSPVIPLLLFNPVKMSVFYSMMKERQNPIMVVVVAYPATAIETARVRLCVSAAHTKEDIDMVLSTCDEIGDALDLKHGITKKERWGVEEVVKHAVELANM